MDEPTVEDMGEIIRCINSGGVRGLRAMGFIPDHVPTPGKNGKYTVAVVQKAFSGYYAWITSGMEQTDKSKWRWSVVTGENHLCKHARLLELVTSLPS